MTTTTTTIRKKNATVRITEHNGGVRGFLRALRALGQWDVEIGVIGDTAARDQVDAAGGDAGDVTNAQLLLIHELGAPRAGIPARAPLQETIKAHRAEYGERLKKISKAVLLGKITAQQGLEALGLKAEADAKSMFATSLPPPNKPATIARKKSSTTLVDLAQLKNALTSRVTHKGKAVK